ncbi:MAG: hypothetical protein ACP5II_06690 [Infirmifilum sp.]|uniref:hypothetical protein n=1 Tax=Infirmifilum TaxID=2856573 RepID=UPI002355AF64
MEDPKKFCWNTLICFISVLSATAIAFYVGLVLARFNPILLPLILTLAVYPGFAYQVYKGKLWTASLLVFSWAILASLLMIHYAYSNGLEGAGLVAKGADYVKEMFSWIATGKGAEGDPSLFIVPKIIEIVVFSMASFLTVGFAGLFMGAYLLDYMNFYVGILLLHAKPGHFLEVALLSWQIYAILRVVGYVLLGTSLSRISLLFFKKRKLIIEDEVKKMLLYSLVFIALDFLLKGVVANAFYQPMLKLYVSLP